MKTLLNKYLHHKTSLYNDKTYLYHELFYCIILGSFYFKLNWILTEIMASDAATKRIKYSKL